MSRFDDRELHDAKLEWRRRENGRGTPHVFINGNPGCTFAAKPGLELKAITSTAAMPDDACIFCRVVANRANRMGRA